MATGNYRVTINGFEVKSETADHALEVDGKRDEVYTAMVGSLMKNGIEQYTVESLSATLGDTNSQNGRIRAGTASRNGGLRTGDRFPSSRPWARGGNLADNYPPFAAWSGELTRGEDVLCLTPAVFEWDGGSDSYGRWVQWGQETLQKIRGRLEQLLGPGAKPVLDWVELGLDVAVSIPAGRAGDRPIGMKREGDQFVFKPRVMLLTYDIAEAIVSHEPIGRGNGVLSFRFQDDSELRGDYVLYLQVEKLVGVTDRNQSEQSVIDRAQAAGF